MASATAMPLAKLGSELMYFSEQQSADFHKDDCIVGNSALGQPWNFASAFLFEKGAAPDEYKNIFMEFNKALAERESAIAAKLSESGNKTLRGLRLRQ